MEYAQEATGAEVDPEVALAELRNDTETIPNARLLDPNVLSDTFTARQQIRNVYGFPEKLDIDRYTVDGETGDYVVAVRELNTAALTENQSTWINRHTVYTHGHGFVARPANEVVAGSEGGEPNFTTRDLPTRGNIPVEQARIYYGELIPRTSTPSSARPTARRRGSSTCPRRSDERQINNTYDGKGGVEVGSFFRQLTYAIYYRERNFLLSGAVNDTSKVLYVRDPRERVEKVAPFLEVDGDPYPAVVDGRITWILDGYTTSGLLPVRRADRAGRGGDRRADRHGHHGAAQRDLQLHPQLGEGHRRRLRRHGHPLRVGRGGPGPRDLHEGLPGNSCSPRARSRGAGEPRPLPRGPVQGAAGHPHPLPRRRPDRLLQPERPVAGPGRPDPGTPTRPSRRTTSWPSGPVTTTASFQLTSALNAFQRDNLSAFMSASSDPDTYGEIQVLRLPGNTPFRGPAQVQNAFTTNNQVRPDLTLFDSENSNAVFGNLLTLPIGEDGLLYVEPLYVAGSGENSFPLLQQGAGQLRGPDRLRRHAGRGAGPGLRCRGRRGGQRQRRRTGCRRRGRARRPAGSRGTAPTAAGRWRDGGTPTRRPEQAVADINAALEALERRRSATADFAAAGAGARGPAGRGGGVPGRQQLRGVPGPGGATPRRLSPQGAAWDAPRPSLRHRLVRWTHRRGVEQLGSSLGS